MEIDDEIRIERPTPKYGDGRRTSAPAILWSAASFVTDQPTTSATTPDSINILQRLLEKQKCASASSSPDSGSSSPPFPLSIYPFPGIGLDLSVDHDPPSYSVHPHVLLPGSTVPLPGITIGKVLFYPYKGVIHSAPPAPPLNTTNPHNSLSSSSNLPPFLWSWINGECWVSPFYQLG